MFRCLLVCWFCQTVLCVGLLSSHSSQRTAHSSQQPSASKLRYSHTTVFTPKIFALFERWDVDTIAYVDAFNSYQFRKEECELRALWLVFLGLLLLTGPFYLYHYSGNTTDFTDISTSIPHLAPPIDKRYLFLDPQQVARRSQVVSLRPRRAVCIRY